MEFKGTKGKWCLKLHDGKYWKVINENNETICNVNSKPTLKIKEEQANAQLIAHAPEMLEAMQEFCDRVDKGEVRSSKTYIKFKNIIQKATTI